MKTLLIDIYKRLTAWNKSVEVYANDVDNAYPERMDRLINNSVTAKTAANIMVQYLLGRGYGQEINDLVVNPEKNLRLIDFADDIANSIVKQRGVFIHINWNAAYQITDMSVIPFDWCRLGKADSKDYSGKIVVHKEWAKAKKGEGTAIDVYNPRHKVIDAQVEKAGGWDSYKGQILYINMDSDLLYPLSRVDAVADDCDSEAQAAIYKNRILRKGFFGNTLVVTRPLIGPNVTQGTPEYAAKENERDEFQKAIKTMLGADNAGGVLCLEMDFAGEKLDDAILIKQIESNIDDELFDFTEASIRDNILIAFNNLPVGLIKAAESVFANSGEALLEMKRSYWENTEKERDLLTRTINMLLSKSADHKDITVLPKRVIQADEVEEGKEPTPDKEKLLAQANLKGSVGGVDALINLIESVKTERISYDSAIEILIEIFGFSEEKAKAVLGAKKETL